MSTPNQQLEAILAALGDFIEILNQEATALSSNDAEQLSMLTVRKQELALAVGKAWRELIKTLGLKPEAKLSELRRGDLSISAVDKMESLSKEAERLNQINGKLIEEQIRRTQAAMHILQLASASHNLYGADGLMVGSGKRNRSIDKA